MLQKPKDLWNELGKSIIGRSEYSFYGLFFFALHATGGMIRPSKRDYYIKKGVELRQRILNKLDTNGVLFYPTFPQPAMRHCESISKMSGVMYTMFFNLMGFPSTHVPVKIIYNFLVLLVKVSSYFIVKLKLYHHVPFSVFVLRWERIWMDCRSVFRYSHLFNDGYCPSCY